MPIRKFDRLPDKLRELVEETQSICQSPTLPTEEDIARLNAKGVAFEQEYMAIESVRPPISAAQAIAFAVESIDDFYNMHEFLKMWDYGQWDDLRREFPEAFE